MAEFSTKLGDVGSYTAGTLGLNKPDSGLAALEEIQTPKFFDTLKSYYSYREANDIFKSMDNADLLEYFYNDRSWRNMNTISMGMDMTNIFGEDDPKRLEEFAYIQQTYSALPSWWNDPNRSFGGWLIDNGGALILDPVNLVGIGVGAVAAKQSFAQALKLSLRAKMLKEVNKKTIEEAAKLSTKKAFGRAVKKGALTEGYIGTIIGGTHDSMLQGIAIQSGVQDEFSYKQAGIASVAGFGFGTVFGGAFAAGSFKLTNKLLKNKTVKNLNDFHEYGRSTTTGQVLFEEIAPDTVKTRFQKGKKIKGKSKEEIDKLDKDSRLHGDTTEERIKNLRKWRIKSNDKPPHLRINVTKYEKGSYRPFLKKMVVETFGDMPTDKVSVEQMIAQAEKVGFNRRQLEADARAMIKDPKYKDAFAYIIAHADAIARELQDAQKLRLELTRIDLSLQEQRLLMQEINLRDDAARDLLKVQEELQKFPARAVFAGNVVKKGLRARSTILDPEDIKMKKLKEGSFEEQLEFHRTAAMLTDEDQILLAMQNVKKVGKWDLAAEYINNNLLSSPDTHIINIVSGLTQTQWKPFVMVLRAANMYPKDKQRAWVIAREAFHTYVMQYAYTAHALKRAMLSFYHGRPILDSQQMKWDSNIRQGQLQKWINETASLGTKPIGLTGKFIPQMVRKAWNVGVSGVALATTLPMRILAAGDEYLKSMMFRARLTSIINSKIIEETGNFSLLKGDAFKKWYKTRWHEIAKDYVEPDVSRRFGTEWDMSRARLIGDTIEDQLNSPLHYAREGSYTQRAGQINPVTNKRESQITGEILGWTNKHRWSRAFGLHFINTPSNLLRWNFQHLPVMGRFQFQMRHMLAEVGDKAERGTFKGFTKKALGAARSLTKHKKYINPEAAAEANARIQMGWALWTSAVMFAQAGKFTGGGSRDWRINQQRESMTGWQPYSFKTDDGRYISLNRLDPIFMPFFIAADMYERVSEYFRYNEFMPEEMRSKELELSLGVVATLVRNLTSKFYTKNILETANYFMSDDFLHHRKPEYMGISMFSRGIYKVMPLSGGLRYLDRINDDWEQDLWTFNDRMTRIFMGDKSKVMPRRNMIGEKINRKNGWLFGLGGETGLWSTPFAMTQWKNETIANFFEGREFNYRAPPKKGLIDIGVDLRTIKRTDGQTAYDRWLELKQSVTFKYGGKNYKLKDFIEKMIEDKTSPLHKHPSGTKETKMLFFTSQKGYDFQQNQILQWVHQAERTAYFMMLKEFPEIKTKAISNAEQLNKGYEDAKRAIQILTQ